MLVHHETFAQPHTCARAALSHEGALKNNWRRTAPKTGERGAAALEYILVSTFAAVVAMAALTFVGKVVKEQLATMATKLGVHESPDITSPFTSSTQP